MRRSFPTGWWWVVWAVGAIAGCTATTAPVERTIPESPVVRTFTDDAGRRVRIEGTPERIVALAPNLTEIVFSVGAGEALVGVSDFSDYPAEAKEIPSVGGFPLNIELIVSLEPDLVLAAGITSLEDVARLEDLGMTLLYLDPMDLDGVLESIRTVGDVMGRDQEAEVLVDSLRDRLEAIGDRTDSMETRPRVYYEIDPTLYSGGPGSFTHELIDLAGGANIAAGAASPFPQMSAEEIIAADPEVILFSHAKYGGTVSEIAGRPGWEAMTAVESGAIYPIDPDLVDRPGPRILDGLEAMARLIHPDLF
ncbi:MAG: ABC transporter substrate-binding protein [Anaerolineae bacterium]